jgi:curved DNA-binding protein CbpA
MTTHVDYYAVLGVERAATAAQIRSAYRKVALQLHPDRHPGDKDAEARFRGVAQAYSVLSDERQREIYDRDTSRSTPRPEPWRTHTTVWSTRTAFARGATMPVFNAGVFFGPGSIDLGAAIPVEMGAFQPGQTIQITIGSLQMMGVRVFVRRNQG